MSNHYMSKTTKREGFLKSKKTWLLSSMWFYSMYLVFEYNFTFHLDKGMLNNASIYFNLPVRRFLGCIAMIITAYYFFSKAVKGSTNKILWKTIMKGMIVFGLFIDLGVLITLICNFFSASNIEEFKELLQ